MSKYLEYLKLVPKGLSNAKLIIEGIVNNVEMKHGNLPQEFKDEVIRRRVICYSCPFNNVNAATGDEYFSITGKHYKSDRVDDHCAFCGCPLDVKTASLSTDCGIRDWNNHHENQIELKWTSYGKE